MFVSWNVKLLTQADDHYKGMVGLTQGDAPEAVPVVVPGASWTKTDHSKMHRPSSTNNTCAYSQFLVRSAKERCCSVSREGVGGTEALCL